MMVCADVTICVCFWCKKWHLFQYKNKPLFPLQTVCPLNSVKDINNKQ